MSCKNCKYYKSAMEHGFIMPSCKKFKKKLIDIKNCKQKK
jgi:hypothetical protein